MQTFKQYITEAKDKDGLSPEDHQHIYHLAVAMNRRHGPQYGVNNPTDTPQNFEGTGGLDKHFGWSATMGSAKFAYMAMKRGNFDRDHIASEIHKGWASVATTHPNQTPEQKERRGKLVEIGKSGWDNFSKEEKDKDRELGDAAVGWWRQNKQGDLGRGKNGFPLG